MVDGMYQSVGVAARQSMFAVVSLLLVLCPLIQLPPSADLVSQPSTSWGKALEVT